MKTVSRVASLDGLRGLLAAFVMIAHYLSFWHGPNLLPEARIAVMMFFLMSGYVLTLSWDGNLPVFLVRRFIRLWPVFAFCLTLGAILFGQAPPWTNYVWYPMVDSNDLFVFDPPMWSLFVEAWAMALMPLIVWGGRTPLRVAMTIVLFVALSHFMANAVYGSFFVIGSFCTKFSFNFAILNTRILQWLGKISYSLYLTHCMVLVICDVHIPSISMYVQIPLCLLAAQAAWAVIESPSIEASRFAAKRLYGGQEVLRSAYRRLLPSRPHPS